MSFNVEIVLSQPKRLVSPRRRHCELPSHSNFSSHHEGQWLLRLPPSAEPFGGTEAFDTPYCGSVQKLSTAALPKQRRGLLGGLSIFVRHSCALRGRLCLKGHRTSLADIKALDQATLYLENMNNDLVHQDASLKIANSLVNFHTGCAISTT